jgi:outer membrane receptor protein involved in Fe transport
MGRLRAEGNLYYSIYDDYQSFVFDDTLPSQAATINAGEAEITGFEWLLQWQFNDQWSFAFNGHVTESEFTSLHPGFSSAREGDPLNAVEKYGYGVSVDYAFNWSSSVAGSAYMGYNRQGPSTTTFRDAGFARGDSVDSDATGYLDMHIGAEWDTFTVSFFGRNLTNEKRPNIIVLASEFFDTQSRPRELGVELSYRF